MRFLVPEFILKQAQSEKYVGSLEGFTLNIDLIGFTLLTNDLISKTDTGAEVLNDVTGSLFEPALDAIEKQGGQIAQFAGDSFTALFPDETADMVIKGDSKNKFALDRKWAIITLALKSTDC